jgi:beta-lactam-binding protein with PASTA domain
MRRTRKMNEEQAEKILTDAGFVKSSGQWNVPLEAATDETDPEEPLFFTIAGRWYRHEEFYEIVARVYVTRGSYRHPLPPAMIEHYEKKNEAQVQEALNEYNFKVTMRFCV